LPRASNKALDRFRPLIARANGELGASNGGKARAASLTPRRRKQIATQAPRAMGEECQLSVVQNASWLLAIFTGKIEKCIQKIIDQLLSRAGRYGD
jgi:hypothetical protein